MVRPRTFSRALVTAAGFLAAAGLVGLSATPATALHPAEPRTGTTPTAAGSAKAAAAVKAARAEPVEEDTAPLAVRIETLSPSTLPASGPVRLSGTVTNRTAETWTRIRLYTFLGDQDPIRRPAQLEAAMDVPFDADLGDRITETGRRGEIDEIAPGATRSFAVTVPAEDLEVTRPGVYWFGVHALGDSSTSAADDTTADGRARTFLPFVPPRYEDNPIEVAVTVPLTAPVRYAADGTLDDVETWLRWLQPEGRLGRLLGFVDAGPAVTWAVDPAVLDAVSHLARGNRPRSIAPTGGTAEPTGDPTTVPEPPSETPTEDPTASAEPVTPEAQAATAWLARLGDALQGAEVRTLPYGNLDVDAVVRHDPRLLDLALAQRSPVLTQLGIEARPVVLAPNGYLDPDTLAALDPTTTAVVTDRMLPGTAVAPGAPAAPVPPVLAAVGSQRVVATSSGAAQGSPGPGPSLTSVGLRQRILAEAAVRRVTVDSEDDAAPLSVVLPLGWSLDDALGFFSGLDVAWLDLGTLGDVESAATPVPVAATDLVHPPGAVRGELGSDAVTDVADLIEAGDVLQDVLLENNEIGGVITEEALTALSYAVRRSPITGRITTGASRDWVDDRLDDVEVSSAKGVTLSGASGAFQVTLVNRLDQRVEVRVVAETDSDITLDGPERIEIGPNSRTTENFDARTSSNRVHNVRLVVTDLEGHPLGSTDDLPVRSAQVSEVIWLIMGTGAGLLFLAIVVRLVRQVRAARRGDGPPAFATRAEQAEAAERSEAAGRPAEVP